MLIESRLIRIIGDGNVYKKQDLLKYFTSEKEFNKTISNIKSYGLNLVEDSDYYQLEKSLELLSDSNIYNHSTAQLMPDNFQYFIRFYPFHQIIQ